MDTFPNWSSSFYCLFKDLEVRERADGSLNTMLSSANAGQP